MKKIFKVKVAAALALVCLVFAACFIEFEGAVARTDPWGYGGDVADPFSGEISGQGFGYGIIGVEITLVDGFISVVEFDLSNETESFAAPLPGILRPMILNSNNFDIPDRTAGATLTVMGIKEAARRAFIYDEDGPKIPRDLLGF
jgi:hypothetical protein